jgi:ribosomal protein S27AE
MENLLNAEYSNINYDNATFQAAVCHRCGAKMFPTELLEAHMDRHQLKDLYLEGELKKLQYSMGRMR